MSGKDGKTKSSAFALNSQRPLEIGDLAAKPIKLNQEILHEVFSYEVPLSKQNQNISVFESGSPRYI